MSLGKGKTQRPQRKTRRPQRKRKGREGRTRRTRRPRRLRKGREGKTQRARRNRKGRERKCKCIWFLFRINFLLFFHCCRWDYFEPFALIVFRCVLCAIFAASAFPFAQSLRPLRFLCGLCVSLCVNRIKKDIT